MRKWLRPSAMVMALLALLASVLPSSAWSCPTTGRVGSASTVCAGMMPPGSMPGDEASPPCHCCKPVSVPPLQGQTDDEKQHHPLLSPASDAGAALAFLLAHPVTVEVAAAMPDQLRPPLPVQSWLARRANSPPPLRLQHRPASIAGRAPPAL